MIEGKPTHEVEIAELCPAAWDEMSGTGAARQCAQCGKTVHHLSAMDPSAAAELLAQPGALCVRVRCDSEGFVIHDAPTEQHSVHRRLRLLSPVVLAAMAACATPGESDLALVVEGPGFIASPVQLESSSGRALRTESSAVEPPAEDTPSAERATPAWQTRTGEHAARQPPTLSSIHFMGVTGVRDPVRPVTKKPTSKAPSDQQGHTDSEFDFGI